MLRCLWIFHSAIGNEELIEVAKAEEAMPPQHELKDFRILLLQVVPHVVGRNSVLFELPELRRKAGLTRLRRIVKALPEAFAVPA